MTTQGNAQFNQNNHPFLGHVDSGTFALAPVSYTHLGVWNPIYIGTLCFACNTDWFARTGTPMPTCWDDLLSPALAGQIVMATPKSSGTSYTTLATLVQMRGEDKAWEYRCV